MEERRYRVFVAQPRLVWGSVASGLTPEEARTLADELNKKRTVLMVARQVVFMSGNWFDPPSLYYDRSAILESVEYRLQHRIQCD